MSATPMDLWRELSESVGFSIADAAPFKQQQRVDHAKYLVELQPTFNALASPRMAKACLQTLAAFRTIRYGTLKDWRMHRLKNPNWRPDQNRNAHRRALNEDEEAEILQELRECYLSKGIYCPHKLCSSRQNRCGQCHTPGAKKPSKRKNGADWAKKKKDEASHCLRTDGGMLS
jgi:mono/diheme cytochrome c family protein